MSMFENRPHSRHGGNDPDRALRTETAGGRRRWFLCVALLGSTALLGSMILTPACSVESIAGDASLPAATAALAASSAAGTNKGVPAKVWSLKGNLGSAPDVDYLGTADPVDLVLRTNAVQKMLIPVDGAIVVASFLINDDLTVGGATALHDTLTVSGSTTLNSTLNVQGHATLSDGLIVSGDASIPGLNTSELTFQDITLSGTTTVEILTIMGGADIAEPFEIRTPAGPGMVVAIDAEHPGELRVADQPYDTAVAGIISGANGINPGLTLSQEGTMADGSHPVALTGRVWCLVDADANGPVQPGDLLTTSGTPGHAMKASDRKLSFGTSIGKAMTALDQGRGLVLVLVSLQ